MATKGSLVGNQSLQPKRPVRYVAAKKTVKSVKRKKKKPEWDVSNMKLTETIRKPPSRLRLLKLYTQLLDSNIDKYVER